MDETHKIIAQINAMLTLVDKFPMNILSGINTTTYTSSIDFLLDVLSALGVNPREVMLSIIKDVFSLSQGAVKKIGEIGTGTAEDGDKDKIDDIDETESTFLQELGDAVKTIIMNILTGIFSCSAIPEIPNKYMDENGNGFPVPINVMDMSGILDVFPLSELGKNYYDANGLVSNANSLYRASDMNAFIWYCVNRGDVSNMPERNKMMWDTRRNAKRNGISFDNAAMDDWINSRQGVNETLNNSIVPYVKNYPKTKKYHPVLQFLPSESSGCINVAFPWQHYANTAYGDKKLFNKTMYAFNKDYLYSIKIFNPKIILTNMVQAMLNFSLKSIASLKIERSILDEKLNEVVKNAIEADDMEVNDCYYTFSNDDYNRMLNQTLMKRYNAKACDTEDSKSVEYDIDSILSQLDEINQSASSVEKTTKITKLFTQLTEIPGSEGSDSVSLTLETNTGYWRELLASMVVPMARALFTPQVMLLFMINFQVLGVVNFKNKMSNDEIMSFMINKMLAIIVSLVKYVKDKLIELIVKLFKEKIKEFLDKLVKLLFQEYYAEWLALLAEGVAACASIKFAKNNNSSDIDDVDYADIVPERTIPESGSGC